jgi:ribosomal protein S18 acetylase RimI-like enzyme
MEGRLIYFSNRKSAIDLRKLQQLLQSAAFWAKDRKLEELRLAIVNSNPVISAWDGSEIVGFARATSDGVFRATIWDVVVSPDWQGSGLGSRLMEELLKQPRLRRVERVYLMTSHQQGFYERLGFTENQTTTMVSLQQVVAEDIAVAAAG